jgi:membrane protein implicated in regulation of membrane protease activity
MIWNDHIVFSIERKPIMKPVTTIVAILLMAISIAHLLRLILQVNIVANGVNVPIWLSIVGCIIPAVLAFMLWRENRK